jgi:intraflagellar transport protein 80
MLRSTVLQNESAIRCARWSPNSSAIVYCHGSYMAIKNLTANSKVTKWRAHEHLVLCLAWSNDNGLIASGNRRYSVHCMMHLKKSLNYTL